MVDVFASEVALQACLQMCRAGNRARVANPPAEAVIELCYSPCIDFCSRGFDAGGFPSGKSETSLAKRHGGHVNMFLENSFTLPSLHVTVPHCCSVKAKVHNTGRRSCSPVGCRECCIGRRPLGRVFSWRRHYEGGLFIGSLWDHRLVSPGDTSRCEAYRLPDEELCTEEHAHNLQAVAAKGDDPTNGIVAAAGPGVHSQKNVVGLACWIGRHTEKDKLTFSLPGAVVAALAFLPGRAFLAGGVNLMAMAVACIWNLSEAGAAREICEVRLDMRPGLRCLAIGHDGSQRHREVQRETEARRASSKDARSGRRPSQTGLFAAGAEPVPAAVFASSGADSRIVVHEVRCGFRTFFDISEPTDADLLPRRQLSQLAPTVLRFANSGRLLAAGDNAGRVHLFLLARHRAENDIVQMRVQAHRVLSLNGHVCDIILKGEQLFKAVCLHGLAEARPKQQEAAHGDRLVLVYDLLNPSLEFMLPDLKMKAEDVTWKMFSHFLPCAFPPPVLDAPEYA